MAISTALRVSSLLRGRPPFSSSHPSTSPTTLTPYPRLLFLTSSSKASIHHLSASPIATPLADDPPDGGSVVPTDLHQEAHSLTSHVNATTKVLSLMGKTSLGTVKPHHVRHPSLVRHSSTAAPDDSSAKNSSVSTPETTQYVKFKRLDKMARNIMQILDKEAVVNVKSEREIPDVQPGCIVQIKVEVPENKRRVTTMKGIVIARRNAGLNTTIRLRRVVAGVGVESLLPLYSPNIKEMKILERRKVRRAKLYYLRDRMNPLLNK